MPGPEPEPEPVLVSAGGAGFSSAATDILSDMREHMVVDGRYITVDPEEVRWNKKTAVQA
jgi:hypothetical protein